MDDYLADKIGEVTFAEKARAWQGYSMSYRPLVEYAKENKLPVIAANAPEKAIFCIGREGPRPFSSPYETGRAAVGRGQGRRRAECLP